MRRRERECEPVSPLSIATYVAMALLMVGLASVVGCDRESDSAESEEAEAESAESEQQQDEEAREADEADKPGSGGEHDEVELAGPMYELGRRFSAIWYAGRDGNMEMVDYQHHEIEELVEELEEGSPTENGVEVVPRLQNEVVKPIEEMEGDVEEGDTEAFESAYTDVMDNCTGCHADTDHAYLRVEKPEYNPYPNLRMEKSE